MHPNFGLLYNTLFVLQSRETTRICTNFQYFDMVNSVTDDWNNFGSRMEVYFPSGFKFSSF